MCGSWKVGQRGRQAPGDAEAEERQAEGALPARIRQVDDAGPQVGVERGKGRRRGRQEREIRHHAEEGEPAEERGQPAQRGEGGNLGLTTRRRSRASVSAIPSSQGSTAAAQAG